MDMPELHINRVLYRDFIQGHINGHSWTKAHLLWPCTKVPLYFQNHLKSDLIYKYGCRFPNF